MPKQNEGPSQCFHVIKHVKTEKERADVRKALELAREVGDDQAILLYVEQLTGECR